MEDLNNIEELLEKYYNGETSIEEERKLQWYFQTQDVPEKYQQEKRMFSWYYRMRKESEAAGLTGRLSEMIDREERKGPKASSRRLVAWMSSAAAVILVLLAVWLTGNNPFGNPDKRFADTYQNPKLAYNETRKALLMVSEKLNEGTSNLEKLNSFNKGMESLRPVITIGPDLQHLEKLSTFNDAIDLIKKEQKENQ